MEMKPIAAIIAVVVLVIAAGLAIGAALWSGDEPEEVAEPTTATATTAAPVEFDPVGNEKIWLGEKDRRINELEAELFTANNILGQIAAIHRLVANIPICVR